MKTYTILATIAFVLLLMACSPDDEQIHVTTPPNKVQQFDSYEMTLKDPDTIQISGEPIKTNGKD